jgi:hypothetical protein
MEELTKRFDVLQEQLMRHYESESKSLQDQINYWEIIRKESALLHYARQQGITKLGLQPVPALVVSEYNGKQAITISLTLQSLLKSPFGKESWTLPETSAELINTEPKNTLKKNGFTVTVWFDNDRNNAMQYTNWNDIYFQDYDNVWHKVKGLVDYNGLYFVEPSGDRAYFKLFSQDAELYSKNQEWTVYYKTYTISPPSGFSSAANTYSRASETSKQPTTRYTSSEEASTSNQQPSRVQQPSPPRLRVASLSPPQPTSTTKTPERESGQRRRRREQRERGSREATPAKRRRTEDRGGGGRRGGGRGAPTAEEVGQRHRSVETKGLSRLGVLQEEARDPPVIIILGGANALKCFRYRKTHSSSRHLFLCISSVFKWVGDCGSEKRSRMLVAFKDYKQRDMFIRHTTLPKGSEYFMGQLNGL